MPSVQIEISDKIYVKNPDESKLGRKILQESIVLLDRNGFEGFTFKKLAAEIGSTEASVYRYFENKHKLLVYLVSWYWNWLEFHYEFRVRRIDDPAERLKNAIAILSEEIQMDPTFMHIDESALHRVVVSESAKAFLTKSVEEDQDEGYFLAYQRLVQRWALLVTRVNPDYKYPLSLVSTIIETAHSQRFFSMHIPTITEISSGDEEGISDFLNELVFKIISK